MGWLVWEEARARERSNLLAARLRAARERAQAGGASYSGPLGSEAPGDGDGSLREHESGGVPEGVFRASDARKTREPHVPLRRGDVGVAQGGGAEKDASDGPQERPGPVLSKKTPARRAAPGVVSSEPLLREGEKGAPRTKVQPPEEGLGGGHRRSWGGERGDARGPPSRSDGRRARRRGAFEGGARVRAGRRALCATR